MADEEKNKEEDVKQEEVNKEEGNKEEDKKEEDLSPIDVLTKGLDDIFSEEETKDEEVEDKLSETEDSETKKESEDGDEVEAKKSPEVEKEPIPQNQVDIARKLGFSDEKIIKLAEESPDLLDNMVKLYSEPAVPQREVKPEVVVKEEEKAKPVKIDHVAMEGLDELEPDAAKIASTLLKGQNDLIDVINKQEEKLHSLGEHASGIDKKNQDDTNAKIDNVFDGASEHVPELGKTESMTPAQAKVRQKVYGMAKVIENTDGLSESKALEEAIYLFGLSKVDLEKVEQEAEERVKEKINKNKKQMSPRPGGKQPPKKTELGKEAAIDTLTEGLKEIFGN